MSVLVELLFNLYINNFTETYQNICVWFQTKHVEDKGEL